MLHKQLLIFCEKSRLSISMITFRSSWIFFNLLLFILLQGCGGSGGGGSEAAATTPASTTASWELNASNGVVKMTSPSHQLDQFFGRSVAIGDFNGDGLSDMAVGAPMADLPISTVTPIDTGAVYIFYDVNSETLTRSRADLVLRSGTDFNSQFGFALYAGDLNSDDVDDLIVGAPYDDRVGTNTGSLYFYAGSLSEGINPVPTTVMDNPSSTLNASFGSAILRADLNGDTFPELIVGAEANDVSGTDRGGFWILRGQASGFYNPSLSLLVTDSGLGGTTVANGDLCGRSLAVLDYNSDSIQDIIMGCPFDSSAGTSRGAIRVYLGTGVINTWVSSNTAANAEIANPASTANIDNFGETMLVANLDGAGLSDLLVGAFMADATFVDDGYLYVFNDFRSANISLDGRVGAPWVHSVAQRYGHGLATGDLNNDTTLDLAVGASAGNLFGFSTGAVSVFHRSGGVIDLNTANKFVAYDYHEAPAQSRFGANAEFGSALCEVDFNKDGLPDLAVGAYTDDAKALDDGALYIYYGQEDGKILGNPDVTLLSPSPINSARQFGSACLGMDVDADGNEDLLVGAWQNDDLGAGSGSVYVYYGTVTGTNTFSTFNFSGPALAGVGFGSALAKGDLDNDGFDDLVVGASRSDLAFVDRGTVYIFQSNNGASGAINFTTLNAYAHTGAATLDFLGTAVTVFDYDGDGFDDLLAGAPGDDDAGAASGRVYVWLNGGVANTLPDTTHDLTLNAPANTINTGFGSALYSALYSNSSYPDLFVGASAEDFFGVDAGSVYQYIGTIGGFSTVPFIYEGLDLPAVASAELFGSAITVMDFNNDTVADLIIGAPQDDTAGFNSGSVYHIVE